MLAAILALALGAAPLQRPADIVKWTARAERDRVTAGATVTVSLVANVAPGWKLYALTQPPGGPKPLTIAIAKGAPFTIARAPTAAEKPRSMKDDNFDLETLYYEGEAIFTVPVTIPRTASGDTRVPLEITFQACGNGICLRPFTQRVQLALHVRGATGDGRRAVPRAECDVRCCAYSPFFSTAICPA